MYTAYAVLFYASSPRAVETQLGIETNLVQCRRLLCLKNLLIPHAFRIPEGAQVTCTHRMRNRQHLQVCRYIYIYTYIYIYLQG